jgi:dienelactone hydrolase
MCELVTGGFMSKTQFTRRDFLQTFSQAAGVTALGGSAIFSTPSALYAQANTDQIGSTLKQELQPAEVAEFQLRQYLMSRVKPLPSPANAEEWTAEASRLRQYALEEVIFHGWPREWVSAQPRFEDYGLIPSGKGYRTRKLRYEIVPGFWSTALLYEPETPTGKVPATLNLNGHAPQGKAAEYKQKRCINNALQGMFALSLEWLGMGELDLPENAHWFGAHLNLVGACATGLFYLAMRKGIDYLCRHPDVDPQRIGVTGLSGGGWQTLTLSALDERVAVSVPISGHFALISAIERNSDVGDIEYNSADLRLHCDVTVLTAMRAPRPTLLIYAAQDEYGMRAALEKPHCYDEIRPFFKLYGKEDVFAWHENLDPGTHNYQLDNRQQAYAFFTRHFNMPIVEHEIPVDDQIKSCEELTVGLPAANLTIVGLAKKMAATFRRPTVPGDPDSRSAWADSVRTKLRDVLRYDPVTLKHTWPIASTRNKGLETLSYRLEFSNQLSATAVWLKAIAASPQAPVVIILNDEGMQTVHPEVFGDATRAPILSECRANSVAWHVNRGEQVLALNLIFIGDASPDTLGEPKSLWGPATLYTELLAAIGERPLGIEVAQLLAASKWVQTSKGAPSISLEASGIRSQIAALAASALEPSTFSHILTREGMHSFGHLLDKAVPYQNAPELFCLDLYKEFDIDHLVALAAPTKIVQTAIIS